MFLHSIDPDVSRITIASHLEALLAFTKDGATATFVILATNESKEGGQFWLDVKTTQEIVGEYSSDRIEVIIIPQVNKKRGAYKQLFDVIPSARNVSYYTPEQIVFWFVDGDSEIPKELRHCFFVDVARSLSVENKIGGVTVHNKVKVYSNSPWVIALMAYTKGPARSFVMQASPNVLTGRGSMIIGTIALDREFQKLVAEDLINLTGFLIPKKEFYSDTGDDKSTYYFVLMKGWNVRYNPDLYVVCHEKMKWFIEKLPNIWSFQHPSLAVRYCRNNLNNVQRLLRLGMGKLGFTRYMMNWADRHLFWTPLIGPISTAFLMNAWGFDYLYVYISWIVATRSLATFVVCMATKERWSPFYPVILIYIQNVLSLVKLWALVSARSFWTRQDKKMVNPEAPKEISAFIILATMIVMFIGIKTGVIWVPGFQELVVIVKSLI